MLDTCIEFLERTVAGCGEHQLVHANYNGERLSKFCQDQHRVVVNTHHPRGGPTYRNALRGREVESRLDYILPPATRSNAYTLFRPSKRGPAPSAHPPPMPTRPLAAHDTSKTGSVVWRSHNGSARCGDRGFLCNHARSS